MTAILIGLAVLLTAGAWLGRAFGSAAARGDICPSPDDLDLFCPECDSTDLYDWGEEDWWVCHGCRFMFSVKEARPDNEK